MALGAPRRRPELGGAGAVGGEHAHPPHSVARGCADHTSAPPGSTSHTPGRQRRAAALPRCGRTAATRRWSPPRSFPDRPPRQVPLQASAGAGKRPAERRRHAPATPRGPTPQLRARAPCGRGSRRFMSAPHAITSWSTVSRWPPSTASISGVVPDPSATLMSAPRPTSALSASVRPPRAATKTSSAPWLFGDAGWATSIADGCWALRRHTAFLRAGRSEASIPRAPGSELRRSLSAL